MGANAIRLRFDAECTKTFVTGGVHRAFGGAQLCASFRAELFSPGGGELEQLRGASDAGDPSDEP